MLENDNLYLGIAQRAHGQVQLGRDQIANAAVCIAFCAFAVEYGIKRLVYARLYLGAYGERRERMMALMPRRRRKRLRRNFAFVRRYSKVPRPLLREAWTLFGHRNGLVHSEELKGTVTPDGKEEVREVRFHVLGSETIPLAKQCLHIAERTVPALRAALTEKGWNPFGY